MTSTETLAGNNPQNEPFYDAAPPEPHLLYQGEILVDVPLFVMPKESRWLLLRTRSGKPVEEAIQYGNLGGQVLVKDSNQSAEQWDEAGPDGDYAMGRLTKSPVLVLSQTCDIQNKDFIQVAPIYHTKDDSYLGKLTRGEILSAFHLLPHPPHWATDAYADFEQIQAVHKSYRKQIPEHFRLAPLNILRLQQAVTRYFGRPNVYDAHSDIAPVEAIYMCASCFYRNGIVTSVDLKKRDRFGDCKKCGSSGWVIQLGSVKQSTHN